MLIYSNLAAQRFKYNGKELQDELGLGWYDYGWRDYNPELGRWMNIDPLSEKFYRMSPYNYAMDNPVFFIDPNGMEAAAPIYDTGGEFLGTDDQGLQGKAIVTDKKDFKQGMSHKEALGKSLGKEGLKSEGALSKLKSHHEGLKDRPDYDGVINVDEANQWARNAGERKGADRNLYVDVGKIDLGSLTKSDFWKESILVNFADPRSLRMVWSTGSVYGTIKLTLLNQQGDLKLGGKDGMLDLYDFNQDGRWVRDKLTTIGKHFATVGGKYDITPYKIYGYGNAKIPNMIRTSKKE